jgi:hypothetical protein
LPSGRQAISLPNVVLESGRRKAQGAAHPADKGETVVMAVEVICAHPQATAGFPDVQQFIRLLLRSRRSEPRKGCRPNFLKIAEQPR